MSLIQVPMLDIPAMDAEIKSRLDDAIGRVQRSAAFIGGVEVEAFENEFAAFHKIKHAIGVANGTDAITLSLMALGIGGGDEVITTSLSAFPTVEAILRTGTTPVYVDIDASTYLIDHKKIAAAITPRTKAIIPVHLYGLSADLDPLLALAQTHSLKVIEDCAQAAGALYKARLVGTLGDIGCFSFFPSKNLGAYGDGGMVITNDDACAAKIRALRNHGREDRYLHRWVGMNSRLDGIQAAILRVKLAHLSSSNLERRRIAYQYNQELSKDYWVPLNPTHCLHVYHLYVIREKNTSPDKDHRARLRDFLRTHGIQTEIHYPIPLHHQPAFPVQVALPVVEETVDQIISVPLYPGMSFAARTHLIDTLKKWKRVS